MLETNKNKIEEIRTGLGYTCLAPVEYAVLFQWLLSVVVDAGGCSFSDFLSLVSESEAESKSWACCCFIHISEYIPPLANSSSCLQHSQPESHCKYILMHVIFNLAWPKQSIKDKSSKSDTYLYKTIDVRQIKLLKLLQLNRLCNESLTLLSLLSVHRWEQESCRLQL